jgi:hypothetical protein
MYGRFPDFAPVFALGCKNYALVSKQKGRQPGILGRKHALAA